MTKTHEGVALCLSGGGYRAMLFHLGALWRLNQAGWLPRLTAVSSVSGGSIAAGVLALAWPRLRFDANGVGAAFEEVVAAPLRRLAARNVAVPVVLKGVFLPGSVGEHVERAYATHVFGAATLRDLPDHPEFLFNATNVHNGVLWKFSKAEMGDYKTGYVRRPTASLAAAVAASSAFPPFLSPYRVRLGADAIAPGSATELDREPSEGPFLLTDGGVYDNLGLEPVWKTRRMLLVSDGGAALPRQESPSRNWFCHTKRALDIIYNQEGALRKRQLIDAFDQCGRAGTYWGVGTDVSHYAIESLPCPVERTRILAAVKTGLCPLPTVLQERLVNWGYAVSDAALRRYVDDTVPPATAFPYPASAV